MRHCQINSRFAEFFLAGLTEVISSISKKHGSAIRHLVVPGLITTCPTAKPRSDSVGNAQSKVGCHGCQ